MKETVIPLHTEHHAPALLRPFHPSPKPAWPPLPLLAAGPLFFPFLETPVNLDVSSLDLHQE